MGWMARPVQCSHAVKSVASRSMFVDAEEINANAAANNRMMPGLSTDAGLHTSDHTKAVSSSDTRPRFWFEQPQCLPTLQTETQTTKSIGGFGVIGEERALLIRLKLEEEQMDKEVVERQVRV